MVKYFESSTVFHFTWEQVAQGFWKRYPNPESQHVLSEDTVHREVRDNKLISKRLLTKTNRPPKWGEKFISARTVRIVEESIVDLKQKTLTTYTRNIGYASVMTAVEKVVYKPSEENANWTVATRSAWVDSSVFGFGRAIQAFGLERMKKNCHKMVIGFNHVLNAMFPKAKSDDLGLGQSAATANASAVNLSSVQTGKEKLKDAAKKASDLAKAKAESLYASASCHPSQSS
ncbi:PRELI domain-containing protein 1, mitochondrial [Nilaparvata lugens]|uniref:PRELI domain-containing protein 1, mitochondrial n=1 Tax=Nilaparvata lugens TaxID=108931 RepID=UPI000B99BCF3|nr:PRELI domain-containing protein 1, mitochondrial [Nilaparvata lugens]